MKRLDCSSVYESLSFSRKQPHLIWWLVWRAATEKHSMLKFFCLSSKATFTQYQSNFQLVEKLDQTLCHMKLFQILALFTWNCRTVIFPSKMSNSITRKLMLAIYVCNFPLFYFPESNWVTKCPCNHASAVQKFRWSPC